MIKFVNKLTGANMWVADTRVEEYKAAGYKLAAAPLSERNTDIEDKPAKRSRKKVES